MSLKHTWILCLAALGIIQSASAVEPLRPEQADKLAAIIKPAKDEDKWATIPWQIDLWQARKLAAEQGKPILLWEMDGHPLGCT
jgi:hypothetical protein